jgi:hypothetical protein
MSFKKNKYIVIKKAITKEFANFGFNYLQMSAEADFFMLENN